MITKFTLGGVQWNVEINNERLNDLRLLGLCEYSKSLITISSEIKSEDLTEEVLYHEVVHAILHTLDRNDLASNELFVQSFSTLLYQFEKSKN